MAKKTLKKGKELSAAMTLKAGPIIITKPTDTASA